MKTYLFLEHFSVCCQMGRASVLNVSDCKTIQSVVGIELRL